MPLSAARHIAPTAVALAAALAAPGAAVAQVTTATSDLMNLQPQLPVEVEDAEPLPSGVRELQVPLRWTRERDSDNRLLVEPRLMMGFGARWQASVGLPLVVGSSDRSNSGNLRGDLMWKAFDEAGLIPAVALGATLELPTGNDAEGTDITLRALATKTLGATPGTHQIHGNFAYRINDDAQPGERDDTTRFILGYSTPLTPSTVIVADVLRGHGRLGATAMSTVFEVGVRYVFTPGTIVSLGLARGDGDDAPSWGVTAGFQTRF